VGQPAFVNREFTYMGEANGGPIIHSGMLMQWKVAINIRKL
jgi:hypothetical protein